EGVAAAYVAEALQEGPDVRELIRRQPLRRADLADVPAGDVDERQPAEARPEVHARKPDFLGHVPVLVLRETARVQAGEPDARLVDQARVEDVVPVHDGAAAVVELRTGEEAATVGDVREKRREMDVLLGLAVAGKDRVVVAEPVVDPNVPLV